MKKLVCYFVLLLSLFCGIGGASSNKSKQGLTKEDRRWALQKGPREAIKKIYEVGPDGPKYRDLRERDRVISTADTIAEMYPGRPDLQREAIDTWGQCMKEQEINGRKKYTDRDVRILVTYCRRALGL